MLKHQAVQIQYFKKYSSIITLCLFNQLDKHSLQLTTYNIGEMCNKHLKCYWNLIIVFVNMQ